ncbi:MAG: hypothetical protein LBL82_02045 [Oscillospiraceae bacterium]|jgi:hypothetical protein|nr:hypothetical protein [Oscillospiraceae bacterium]
MHSFETLRKKYTEFIYHSFSITEDDRFINIEYHFSIPNLSEFRPRWRFEKNESIAVDTKNNSILQNMVFSLGMTELVSYWKITCAPLVIVKAGHLSDSQIDWWKKQYYGGLGEFFYINKIRTLEADFMKIETTGEEFSGELLPIDSSVTSCLVPVGGGKDSVVTMELLRHMDCEKYGYMVNRRNSSLKTIETAGLSAENAVIASRTLDANMLALNKEGYLNGHTPFSAIVAFSSLIAAYLNNLRYVVLSNESSANESTVQGSDVNHQYSKSFQFESNFSEYEKQYIGSGIYYFSLLRPLSEFQIAKYFAKFPQYHGIFRSCNAGSKEDVWCGHCSKCLFVALILSPFLSREALRGIFKRDMLDDAELISTFRKLVGMEEEKPFECVGSRDEINVAICLAIENYLRAGGNLPALFEYYTTTDLYEKFKSQTDMFDNCYDSENLLPPEFEAVLLHECFSEEEKGL